jgi:hypothetical protein
VHKANLEWVVKPLFDGSTAWVTATKDVTSMQRKPKTLATDIGGLVMFISVACLVRYL